MEEGERKGDDHQKYQQKQRSREVKPTEEVFHTREGSGDEERRRLYENHKNLIYCEFCKDYFPRDFYHCIDCGCCIEKLDHHCPWIGRCIGAKNMKYFIRFNVFWITEIAFVFVILFQDSS